MIFGAREIKVVTKTVGLLPLEVRLLHWNGSPEGKQVLCDWMHSRDGWGEITADDWSMCREYVRFKADLAVILQEEIVDRQVTDLRLWFSCEQRRAPIMARLDALTDGTCSVMWRRLVKGTIGKVDDINPLTASVLLRHRISREIDRFTQTTAVQVPLAKV